jgi:hypothetical protein
LDDGEVEDTGSLSSEVKRQGYEADHSRPISAEVKKNGFIHPLPVRLRGVLLK